MRLLILSLFAITSLWSEDQAIPKDKDLSTRYAAIDAYREEIIDSKANTVTRRVVRYYMKNPVVVKYGSREMMAGEGTSVPGVIYVPLDSVVAIAGFVDNKQFLSFVNAAVNVSSKDATPEIHSSR